MRASYNLRKYFFLILIAMAICISQPTMASGWSGELHVKGVTQAEDGKVFIWTDGPLTTTDGCTKTDWIGIDNMEIVKQVYAMALMAKATGAKVGGWIVDCVDMWGETYPRAVNLRIE